MTNDPAPTVNRCCADVINAHNPAAADDLVATDFTDSTRYPASSPAAPVSSNGSARGSLRSRISRPFRRVSRPRLA